MSADTGDDLGAIQQNWSAGILARIPREAWPFIILAAAHVLLLVLPMGDVGGTVDPRVIALQVAPTLFPVAILIGRRDAWYSARVVMIGAILWGSASSVVFVIDMLRQRTLDLFGVAAGSWDGIHALLLLASALGIAAPAIVAYGLSRRRRTETAWPPAIVLSAVVVTAVFCVDALANALDWYGRLEGPDGLRYNSVFTDQMQFVRESIAPLVLIGLAALVWTAYSAVKANEAPRRFWVLVCAGSALVAAAWLYWHSMALATRRLLVPAELWQLLLSATGDIVSYVELAGSVLLLIGFALGLPESDEELRGDFFPEDAATAPPAV
jgi:hypothetical protein